MFEEKPWLNQDKWFIKTVEKKYKFLAEIFDEEQRRVINDLISRGFYPLKTVAGKANCTRKHWTYEEYEGKNGLGYRMISSYRKSDSFNSITYFIHKALILAQHGDITQLKLD